MTTPGPPPAGPPYAIFTAPATPLEGLPLSVQGCLGPTPGPECDTWMGDWTQKGSFCRDPAMAQTTYCSCVNSSIPCPMLGAASCANTTFAYVPTKMRPGGTEYAACKGANLCVNVVEALGNNDVISNLSQTCSPATVLQTALKNHPALVALVCLALVLLVLLAQGGGGKKAPGAKGARGGGGAPGHLEPPPGGDSR